MEQITGTCQLADIPTAAFEAVLRHLSTPDFAALRQLNRCLSKRTTQQVPYITLLLSENSSNADQLRQWCQATRNFQRVSSIHIHVDGEVPAKVFNEAMQMLSERSTKLWELHILAGIPDTSGDSIKARTPTLLPLWNVLDDIRILVIKGVSVEHLSSDLHQLASAAVDEAAARAKARAAGKGAVTGVLVLEEEEDTETAEEEGMEAAEPAKAEEAQTGQAAAEREAEGAAEEAAPVPRGWQLQQLTLAMPWTYPHAKFFWTVLPATVKQLVSLFPNLKQLSFKHPHVEYHEYDQSPQSWQPERWPEQKYNRQELLAQVAEVAAVANAAVRLKKLELLTLTEVPDLWAKVYSVTKSTAISAAADVAKAAGRDAAALEANAALEGGLVSSVTAAAAAFTTLDDLGCWLLQKHQSLGQVHIETEHAEWPTTLIPWAMSWQQQQQQDNASNSSTAADHKPALLSIESCCMKKREELMNLFLENIVATKEGKPFKKKSVVKRCSRYLSDFSARPAADLMSHITRLKLDVFHVDVHTLIKLVRSMKSLNRLEVTLSRHSVGVGEGSASKSKSASIPTTATTAQLMAAVAAATNLTTLDMFLELGDRNALPDDLLLPLTAAAGGPGSSLKKLKIVVDVPESSTRRDSSSKDQDTANRYSIKPSCFQCLSKLDALTELELYFTKEMSQETNYYQLNLSMLPSSLKVFKGCSVSIHNNSSSASSTASSSSSSGAFLQPVAAHLLLHHLDLCSCSFSSPSILASDQMHELIIINSSWSGGWAAAAAAWPNLRKLVYIDHPAGSSTTDSSSSTVSDVQRLLADLNMSGYASKVRKAAHAVAGICMGFKRLKYLKLTGLPLLPIKILQPLVQHMMQLQHVHYRYTGSSSSSDGRAVEQCLQQRLPWASVHVSNLMRDADDDDDDEKKHGQGV